MRDLVVENRIFSGRRSVKVTLYDREMRRNLDRCDEEAVLLLEHIDEIRDVFVRQTVIQMGRLRDDHRCFPSTRS